MAKHRSTFVSLLVVGRSVIRDHVEISMLNNYFKSSSVLVMQVAKFNLENQHI